MFQKYPFIKQQGIKDCGCACLQMIIEFYHGKIGMETIRDMTKTTKNGTTAFNLIEAAKQIGFEAKGVKATFDQMITEDITVPCIAHTIMDNSYQHYVVIYNIDKKRKKITIADPAHKIKKISFQNFEKIYNNVLIILTPYKPIPYINTPDQKLLHFILKIINTQRKTLFQIIILSIFITLFSIATSFFFQYMINLYSKEYIIMIFIVFLIIYGLKTITDYVRNQILIYLTQQIDANLTIDTFENIISLPYHYYKNRTTGEVLSRINDLSSIKDSITKIILSIFIDFPLSIIAFLVLYMINKELSIIALIILLCYIMITLFFNHLLQKNIDQIQTNKALTTSYMTECISGFETIKGINLENYVTNQLEYKYIYTTRSIRKYQTYTNIQYILKEIINNIGFLIIILIGCLLILENKLTIGQLITFHMLLAYFLEPIKNIIDLNININEAKNALQRIMEMIPEQKEQGIYKELTPGNIEIKQLNYSFNCYDQVLKKLNTTIKQGSKVMIIGKSGSGKSTLLKILMKYYKTQNGQVKINDIDINHYTKEAIKDKIKYISQQETLFTDTLYNNIMLNNNDQTKLKEITKMCLLDEIIEKNNLGYQTLIEENGFNISGGEKQRIVLARTLMTDFEILLIDEGLNQIDINLERKILKNIFKMYQNKTIIIISHRLDNIDLYDQIIEIENGKIKKDIKKNERQSKLEKHKIIPSN